MQNVALIQLNVGPNPTDNLPITVAYLREAADKGADFILTPECSNYLCAEGANTRTSARLEEQDELLQSAKTIAAEYKIWICLGSLILAQRLSDKLLNRQFLIDPNGKTFAIYDKIHLFDVTLNDGEHYRESATYSRGKQAKFSNVMGHKLGHSICYDMRFPRLFRDLGADLFLVPSAFTKTTGEAHWHALLKARAIENGAFVLAAAQTGTHDVSRRTFGHTLAIDPWGKILLDMGTKPGVGIVRLDWNQIEICRSKLPAMAADQPYEMNSSSK